MGDVNIKKQNRKIYNAILEIKFRKQAYKT